MAILGRFWSVVKSNLNYWIGKAEDPEKMLNQMLLDMQEQLMTAKKQVAIAIADEKSLLRQHDLESQKSKEWEQKAMMAINAQKDDLARQALERKAEHDKMATGFQEQWQKQKEAVEQLKVALNTLTNKIGEAKRKKDLLIARAKRAQAEQTIQNTMAGIGNMGAIDTIDRMEKKIDQMEAMAQATSEMAKEIETDELSAQFKKLEVVGSDEALEALKQKMNVKKVELNPSDEVDKIKELEKELQSESFRKS